MRRPPRRSPPARVDLLLAGGLALATLLLYAPAGGFDFVDYDDFRYVLLAPGVKAGFDLAALGEVFGELHLTPPLTQLSHMVDVALFGREPAGHHWTSVALHALNAALLFALLLGLTGRRWPSAFAAAAFACHPLNVESVAWVAERKNLLAGCFGLLTLHAYAAWTRRGGGARYAATLLLLALGLAAKATLVTLPCVMLLLDFWPLRRLGPGESGRRVLEKLPFFALALAASLLTWAAQGSGGAVRSFAQLPLDARLANALVSYAVYLRQFVWPLELGPFYPQLALVGRAPWTPAGLLAAGLLLAGVSWAAWRGRRRWPFLAVGWCWFLGVMVPTAGVVQVGEQARADRYMYLPIIGLLVMLAFGGEALLRRRPALRGGLAVLAVLALLGLVGVTRAQLPHWRSTLPLFERALAVTEDNYVAMNNVAWLRATCRDPAVRDGARAVALAERAVELKAGRSAEFLDTLAAAYAEVGRFEDAIAASQRAIALASERGWARAERSFRGRLWRYQRGEPMRASRGCPSGPPAANVGRD